MKEFNAPPLIHLDAELGNSGKGFAVTYTPAELREIVEALILTPHPSVAVAEFTQLLATLLPSEK